ncbi:MAG: helix-turn-helix domain-containing protein [Steroidobacteraceae bacterium]
MSTVTNQTPAQVSAEGVRQFGMAAHGWNRFIAGPQPFGDDIAQLHCTTTDELTEQVRHWNVEVDRLSAGVFAATGLMIPLESLLLSMCTVNQSVLVRLTPPARCLSIVVPEPGSDPLLFNGRELTEGHCAVLPIGAYAEAVTQGKLVGFAVSVSEDAWDASSDWTSDHSGKVTNEVQVRAPGTQWTAGVLEGMQWIVDAFLKHPEGAMSCAVRASMADLMLVRLHASAATIQPRNDRRGHGRRRIAVERARGFIHENLTRPIRLSELCAHAHLQARSLEYGFLQVVGMSPIAYIRAMRLNRVRRLLLSTHRSERTITEIALDCGFWHLSQFAADYRKFFGESPRTAARGATDLSAGCPMATPVCLQ